VVRGFSFGSYIAMTCGAEDDRVCTLIGIAPPVEKYDYEAGEAIDEAEVPDSWRGRRAHSAQGRTRVLRAAQRAERVRGIDRANHLFEGQASEVGDALEACWKTSHAGRSNRFRQREPRWARRPAGSLRTCGPTTWPRQVITESLRRAPGVDAKEISDVIIGCAMPEAEQGLNVARIASLRAGDSRGRVCRDVKPLLRLRPAGNRLRRRAHHVRRRQRDRGRWDRVDEPRADGGNKVSPNPTLVDSYPMCI
jgi:hypothetical protein